MKTKPRTKHNTLILATRVAVMSALVAVATLIIQIPNPATRGYINFGDTMVFISALTFGPAVGGLAGGIGSAIADVASGYGYFSPFTLVIKGVEGVLAGLLSRRTKTWRDIVAVTVAGAEMVVGYFVAEFFALQLGWAALTEVPGNISQVLVGAVIGVPTAKLLRKRLVEVLTK